ncbi:MAG: hypothetical protein Q7S45_02150 [Candidatus Curtissbacteria bacterium]|nr:hypothetical protein [Candidatus Curtissbacteria bacterium]
MKKVRKVVIPAAGSHIELSVREIYVLASRWRLYGTDPAFNFNQISEVNCD